MVATIEEEEQGDDESSPSRVPTAALLEETMKKNGKQSSEAASAPASSSRPQQHDDNQLFLNGKLENLAIHADHAGTYSSTPGLGLFRKTDGLLSLHICPIYPQEFHQSPACLLL